VVGDGVVGDQVDYLLRFNRINVFIVVAREECSAICIPEIVEDGRDCSSFRRG
jgi:hypothetical protein